MPRYEYECTHCEHNFEVVRSMKESLLTQCPECGRESLQQVLYPPLIHNPQTVGAIAERNTDRLGRYERQEKEHARKQHDQHARKTALPSGMESARVPSSGKRPWWRPDKDKPDMKLGKLATEAWKKHAAKKKEKP